MDTESVPATNPINNNQGKNQNIVIGILIFLLVISFLGINLLSAGSNLLESVYNIFAPIVLQILGLLGFTAGTVINKTADVVSDTTIMGVEIAGDAVQDVGDLLINSTKNAPPIKPPTIDKKINEAPSAPPAEPKPDTTTNPIQNPVSSAKKSWCLVGEYQGRRGCIEITDQDKCISGQVFPEQKMCLNPTLSQNPNP
jgi:hypothetical protein